MPILKDYATALLENHGEVWQGSDPNEYVKRERDSWER